MRPVLAFLVLAASLIAADPALARKNYRAESYRTEITVRENGDLRVRETMRIRFQGGEFTYFFRGIPTEKTDGIEILSASDSTYIKRRNSLRGVTWRFPPCRDTTRTFNLDYLAKAAVAPGGTGSVLRWNLFPYDRPYSIDAAEAWIRFGEGVSGPDRLTTEPGQTHSRGQGGAIQIGPFPLQPEKTVRIALTWTDPLPGAAEPQWYRTRQIHRARMPYVLALAGAILLGGLFILLNIRSRMRAQIRSDARRSRSGRAGVIASPPEEIPAALAGSLAAGDAGIVQVLAGVFDLGQAGAVRFGIEGEGRTKRGKPPALQFLDRPSGLAPWEATLLEQIFERKQERQSVPWSQAQKRLVKSVSPCRKALLEALERRGDLDPSALEARRSLGRYAIVLVIVGLGLLLLAIPLIELLGPSGFAVAVAFLILAGVAGLASATFPLWTPSGRDRARQWKGFARYLKQAAKGSTPLDAERFQAWLPYAVSLGAAKEWTRAAKRWRIPAPAWVPRLEDGSWDTGAVMAVIASTAAAGGSSGSGGGGAGGGGSSGAG